MMKLLVQTFNIYNMIHDDYENTANLQKRLIKIGQEEKYFNCHTINPSLQLKQGKSQF